MKHSNSITRHFSSNIYKSTDRYTELARKQGYPARSVFKLIELQSKFHLLRPGQHVLDLGCSPGSWSLYAGRVVGARGSVTAIDLHDVDASVKQQRNVTFIKADIFQWLQQYKQQQMQPTPSSAGSSLPSKYHVIVSDMAPATSGNKDHDRSSSAHLCYAALYCSDHLLRPNGHLVVKVLQGKDTTAVTTAMKKRFESVKSFKPQSSRANSTEMFLVGRNYTAVKTDGAAASKSMQQPAVEPATTLPLPSDPTATH